MSAPKGNDNATKVQAGTQVNLYLSATDTAFIKQKLLSRGEDASAKAIRRFAREQSKNGIWLAIRDQLPPMII